jgi:hypothetical protein
MSISATNIITTASTSANTATNNAFVFPTTAGTSGQYLISQGPAQTPIWGSISNPFNQSLNTTNAPTFANVTIGSDVFPTTAGTAGQFLQSQGGGSTPAIWSVPKTNIVQATTTNSCSPTTSNNVSTFNWAAFTGLSVSITPLTTTSNVLVSANLSGCYDNVANVQAYATIYRNSTDLSSGSGLAYFYFSGTTQFQAPIQLYFLDSPATTSAITYSIYCCNVGPTAATFNYNNTLVSITAFEI